MRMRLMNSKLPINLEDLLRRRTVEGERIEYKTGWNPDAIMRTVCAFANDFENLGGGYIVIGQDCDDTGQPIFPPLGLRDNQMDKIQRELLSYCNLIQPPYFPILSIERNQQPRRKRTGYEWVEKLYFLSRQAAGNAPTRDSKGGTSSCCGHLAGRLGHIRCRVL